MKWLLSRVSFCRICARKLTYINQLVNMIFYWSGLLAGGQGAVWLPLNQQAAEVKSMLAESVTIGTNGVLMKCSRSNAMTPIYRKAVVEGKSGGLPMKAAMRGALFTLGRLASF
jgi:hypothetical protein